MSPVAVHESAIMERLVLSREKAEAIVSLAFSRQDLERMRELMERNNQGLLTDSERDEMDGFRRVGTLLGILQARARLVLNKRAKILRKSACDVLRKGELP
jgi:hypothetical protein